MSYCICFVKTENEVYTLRRGRKMEQKNQEQQQPSSPQLNQENKIEMVEG